MKTNIALFLLGAALGAAPIFAAESAVAPSAADKAYEEFRVVRYTQVPRQEDVAATSRLQMIQHDKSSRLAEKFYDQFPNDPRKWEIISVAVNSPRQYASGPEAAAEKAAWDKRRDELRRMLLADDSVPVNIWTTVAEWTIDDNSGFRGRPNGDLAWAGRVVEQMAQRVPTSDRRKFAEQAYLDALAKADPAANEAFLRRRVATETNASVKEVAAGRLRIIEAARAPLEIKFTASDGREVDLAKLRGKVVLVDFWATWCVPCMEEMPNVRAAYQKYHNQGFEVIGISFENSRLAKTDSPEVIAQKKQVAKEKMNAFVQANAMPWPHHFDGDYWDNEFGRRFAIHEIPAVFLIGKDGRLITTEAHGANLDREVKRALGAN